MLLRVILSDSDIRKITVDQLPDTVEDFSKFLRTKLGVDGELVVQYQDPEFDMGLCNLTSMSALPQDKATLKVHSKSESYHTDSTLDTANLSSCEESPSTSQPRQLPLPFPFPIPTFAYDVELRLRAANESFNNNGNIYEPPKEMKSDMLDKLAQAIFAYTPYPTREEIEAVAQAHVIKHPCLKDPGSVFGWYSWKFSLKFKVQNFRQKLRQSGCPELSVNKRSSSPLNSKRIKRAKKSEANFLPGFPDGKSENDLEVERTTLRKEIVKDEPLVAQVQERWPALFFVPQIESEFARLTSVNLKEVFFSGLDQYLDRFLELFKAKSGLPELTKLTRALDASTP
ncbi:hypothetical protein XENORESO_017447 [Xenotaenia resolanae]|uniref:PB1 domain-containing protein n=1 Tax=Xenotaenia resolanae TaxID=208358 RepID=A0ABV0W941_9TELE